MPYKRLIPKLYQDGERVRLLADGTVTTILFSVTLSETLLCPHCGSDVWVDTAFGSVYAYFTADVPIGAPCCRPILFDELCTHHYPSEYNSYQELIDSIKDIYYD